eukprot:GHVP01047563.1.p1 GENE.GHVP01047563.1~~GHVP01047563.1.p1  ORF type:complete len:298 (-),score=52.26 GHVP01047563.1:1933-2826(-)
MYRLLKIPGKGQYGHQHSIKLSTQTNKKEICYPMQKIIVYGEPSLIRNLEEWFRESCWNKVYYPTTNDVPAGSLVKKLMDSKVPYLLANSIGSKCSILASQDVCKILADYETSLSILSPRRTAVESNLFLHEFTEVNEKCEESLNTCFGTFDFLVHSSSSSENIENILETSLRSKKGRLVLREAHYPLVDLFLQRYQSCEDTDGQKDIIVSFLNNISLEMLSKNKNKSNSSRLEITNFLPPEAIQELKNKIPSNKDYFMICYSNSSTICPFSEIRGASIPETFVLFRRKKFESIIRL